MIVLVYEFWFDINRKKYYGSKTDNDNDNDNVLTVLLPVGHENCDLWFVFYYLVKN